MKHMRLTAGIMSASMVAIPVVAPINTMVAYAEGKYVNASSVLYGNYDCETNKEVNQGLSLSIQNQGGGDYKHCGVKVYKTAEAIPDKEVESYDLSTATLVTSFHTIAFSDNIWVDQSGNILQKDDSFNTGKPTFKSLEPGNYVLVYDGEMAGFAKGIGMDLGVTTETYQRKAFTVKQDEVTHLDLEESSKIAVKPVAQGTMSVQAIVVATDADGNILRNPDGSFSYTTEVVEGVTCTPVGDKILSKEMVQKYIEEQKAAGNFMITMLVNSISDKETLYKQVATIMMTKDYADYIYEDVATLKTDASGQDSKTLSTGKYSFKTTIPEGYAFADEKNDKSFDTEVKTKETNVHVIELYKVKSTDGEDKPTKPEEISQGLKVIVKDSKTKQPVIGAYYKVEAGKHTSLNYSDISTKDGTVHGGLLADTYKATVTSVPKGYKLPSKAESITLQKATKANTVSELVIYVDKEEGQKPVDQKEIGNLEVIVRDKKDKIPIPNANIVITDKDGNKITATTDSKGKVSKEDLPAGKYTVETVKVPEGYEIPEKQTTTVKKKETSTVVIDLEKQLGNLKVIVVDKETKKPVSDVYFRVVHNDVVKASTDKKGTYYREKLETGKYSVQVWEVPDDYTLPGNKTTVIRKGETSTVIFELEKEKGTVEVIVREEGTKKPIPNATVVITDKDGKKEELKTDKNGMIPQAGLKNGDYTVSVTKVPDGYSKPNDQKITVAGGSNQLLVFEVKKETGILEVIVRDKETKDPIPNAVVKVTDKKGKETKLVTDQYGKVKKNSIPDGEYTVHVMRVPSGYKIPDDQTVTVKNKSESVVIFELEKNGKTPIKKDDKTPNSKNPSAQTGDTTNIFVYLGLAIVSGGGLLLSKIRKLRFKK